MLKPVISLAIAAVLAGLFALVTMFAVPGALGHAAGLVCPAGSTAEVTEQRQETARGVATTVTVACVHPDGRRDEGKEGAAFLALLGLWLVPVFLGVYLVARKVNLVSVPLAPPTTPLPPDVAAAARELLGRGLKIDAVRLVRERTGVTLDEAARHVAALARKR